MARPLYANATTRAACLALMVASCGGGDEPLALTDTANTPYNNASAETRDTAPGYRSASAASDAGLAGADDGDTFATSEFRHPYSDTGLAGSSDSFSQQAEGPPSVLPPQDGTAAFSPPAMAPMDPA